MADSSPSQSLQSLSSTSDRPLPVTRNSNDRCPGAPIAAPGGDLKSDASSASTSESMRWTAQRYPVVGFSGSSTTMPSPSRTSTEDPRSPGPSNTWLIASPPDVIQHDMA